jgi:hypothetical protein
VDTLLKKRRKFPHLEENSEGIGCKVIYEEGLPNILCEEMSKYFAIYDEAVSHSYMILHPIPIDFPYI